MKLLFLLFFLPFALWGVELTVWHELDANAEEKLSLLVAPFEKSTGHKVVFVRPEGPEIAIVQEALAAKELGTEPICFSYRRGRVISLFSMLSSFRLPLSSIRKSSISLLFPNSLSLCLGWDGEELSITTSMPLPDRA